MSILGTIWHIILELWWAIFFAVLVGVYFESRRGKSFVRKMFSVCVRIYKKIVPNRDLSKQEVIKAIKSNCAKVPKKFVARPVNKNGRLTWNKKYIYTDPEKKYLFPRFFSVLPLIDGSEDFFEEGCECLADKLKQIDTSEDFLFVYLNKDTNLLLSNEVGLHFPGKVPSHPIRCCEARSTPRGWNFQYEFGESLSGFRVVLLESFVLIPDILNETVNWLQKQGATVEAVAVLFMGAEKFCANKPCTIGQENVKVACFVDMKITEYSPKKSNGKQLKVLTYSEY